MVSVVAVRDAGIDEEQVEPLRTQALAHCGDPGGVGDVDEFDVQAAVGAVDERMQGRPGALAGGGDHAPAELQVRLHDRQPETAGGAEQEETFFRRRDRHGGQLPWKRGLRPLTAR